MALSINPLAKLLTSTQQSLNQASNLGGNQLTQNPLGKIDLDAKINQLSGGIGSGLNGLSGTNVPNINSATQNAQALLGGAPSALGGISNTVQSNIPSQISSLQTVAGSTSKFTPDIQGSLSKLTGGGLAGGISSFAGTISKAAGNINNILSLVRGANLPAGGELFKQIGSAIKVEPGAKDDWRVRITCQWNIFDSPIFKLLENTGGVVWPYLPTVDVSTSANYSQIDTVHSNQPYYAYKNSQINDISISNNQDTNEINPVDNLIKLDSPNKSTFNENRRQRASSAYFNLKQRSSILSDKNH